MAEIKRWHRKAADQIIFDLGLAGYLAKDTIVKRIAQYAPASTVPNEVIEKYAQEIGDGISFAAVAAKDGEVVTDCDAVIKSILTRFASEVGTVDGTLLDAVGDVLEATLSADHEDLTDAVEKLREPYAAAIKSAGGGKDGSNG